ncbi:MAG: hypothetical protein IJA72_04420 [Clostridia bacterium]|nr:hypothetical protein [Clostridia bacterium]
MIIQETVTLNNRQFKHTYSSDNKYIKQIETGAIYSEAYDVPQRTFNYMETDITLTEEDALSAPFAEN